MGIRYKSYMIDLVLTHLFFDTAPSFDAGETHWYLKNWLGIVHARGGGLLDHPYAPCHPPSVPPTEKYLVGHLTNYCHQMSSCGLYIKNQIFTCNSLSLIVSSFRNL